MKNQKDKIPERLKILRLPLINQKLHTLLYWLLPIGDWSLKCWQKWEMGRNGPQCWIQCFVATLSQCYTTNMANLLRCYIAKTVNCAKWTSMWDSVLLSYFVMVLHY